MALLADAYVDWGLAHPGAYQLLFETAEVALQIWATLHGLVSVRLHKQGAPWLHEPSTDGRRMVDALIAADQ